MLMEMSVSHTEAQKISLGIVLGAHGVRGIVRVKAFTEEPFGVAAYGPVETRDGKRRFKIEALNLLKEIVLCRLEGIDDRDKAEAMKGTELFVSRDKFPIMQASEQWYQADLVGLEVRDVSGTVLGSVATVENFGAGDLLEIKLSTQPQTRFLAFTLANVPEVDVARGFVVIDPPEGWEEEARQSDLEPGHE